MIDGEKLRQALAPYQALVAKVDTFARQVHRMFAGRMACERGCDSCCELTSVLPVEAAALIMALAVLDPAERLRLAAAPRNRSACPFLDRGDCLLYAARPLICRTHGLPLLIRGEQGNQVDVCPKNFTAGGSLPGEAVLDLEALNSALVMINRQFVQAVPEFAPDRDRIPLADLLAGAS